MEKTVSGIHCAIQLELLLRPLVFRLHENA